MLPEEEIVKIAGKYLAAEYSGYAASLLKPYAQKENPDHAVLINYLKASYSHKEDLEFTCYSDPKYVATLLDATKVLSPSEWCSMFVGKCNTSFQIFDHPEVRAKYCEICNERDDVILLGKVK